MEAMGAAEKANVIYREGVSAEQLAMVSLGNWRPRVAHPDFTLLFKSYAEGLEGTIVSIQEGWMKWMTGQTSPTLKTLKKTVLPLD